jgi:hypothetical protein
MNRSVTSTGLAGEPDITGRHAIREHLALVRDVAKLIAIGLIVSFFLIRIRLQVRQRDQNARH